MNVNLVVDSSIHHGSHELRCNASALSLNSKQVHTLRKAIMEPESYPFKEDRSLGRAFFQVP